MVLMQQIIFAVFLRYLIHGWLGLDSESLSCNKRFQGERSQGKERVLEMPYLVACFGLAVQY
jgi:hypothetical protein